MAAAAAPPRAPSADEKESPPPAAAAAAGAPRTRRAPATPLAPSRSPRSPSPRPAALLVAPPRLASPRRPPAGRRAAGGRVPPRPSPTSSSPRPRRRWLARAGRRPLVALPTPPPTPRALGAAAARLGGRTRKGVRGAEGSRARCCGPARLRLLSGASGVWAGGGTRAGRGKEVPFARPGRSRGRGGTRRARAGERNSPSSRAALQRDATRRDVSASPRLAAFAAEGSRRGVAMRRRAGIPPPALPFKSPLGQPRRQAPPRAGGRAGGRRLGRGLARFPLVPGPAKGPVGSSVRAAPGAVALQTGFVVGPPSGGGDPRALGETEAGRGGPPSRPSPPARPPAHTPGFVRPLWHPAPPSRTRSPPGGGRAGGTPRVGVGTRGPPCQPVWGCPGFPSRVSIRSAAHARSESPNQAPWCGWHQNRQALPTPRDWHPWSPPGRAEPGPVGCGGSCKGRWQGGGVLGRPPGRLATGNWQCHFPLPAAASWQAEEGRRKWQRRPGHSLVRPGQSRCPASGGKEGAKPPIPAARLALPLPTTHRDAQQAGEGAQAQGPPTRPSPAGRAP